MHTFFYPTAKSKSDATSWQRIAAMLLGLLVLAGLSLQSQFANATDIYRSIDENGLERYASSPLDQTYTLYLKAEDSNVEQLPKIKLSPQRLARLHQCLPQVAHYAAQYQLDLGLVLALIDVESRFNPQAKSAKGATGLMQLMPNLAAQYGVRKIDDIEQNLNAGMHYLSDLQRQHDGNIALMLAAYNAGNRAITRHGKRIPPYKETMLYVPQVLMSLQATRDVAAEYLDHHATKQPATGLHITPFQ